MKKEYYYLKIFVLIGIFIFFTKENIFAQEVPPEKYHQKKIGNHFLIDFPNNPSLIAENNTKEDNTKENNSKNDQFITVLQSISEDGNMRFRATHKKMINNNVNDNHTIIDFYQKEIKKFVLPVGGMLYDQQNIEIAHHKGIKFRVKFRKSPTQKTHKEQNYMMFLINEDYYLFAYLYEGLEKKPSRELELHFFQSLQEK